MGMKSSCLALTLSASAVCLSSSLASAAPGHTQSRKVGPGKVAPAGARGVRTRGPYRPGSKARLPTGQSFKRLDLEFADIVSAVDRPIRFPRQFPVHLRGKVAHILQRKPVNYGFGMVKVRDRTNGRWLWGVYERIVKNPALHTYDSRRFLVDAAGNVVLNEFPD